VENILNDISGDLIVGQDLKYDDSFLLIEQEIDKVYSVSAEETTDWLYVQKNCFIFLRDKSKDLKIAVWWLFAYWNLDNWNGLQSSLDCFNQFLTKYKQNLFPKSIKAKTNTILWLEDTLTKEIVEKKLHNSNLIDPSSVSKLFESLQQILIELLETDDKYFTKVIRYLNKKIEQNNLNSPTEIIEEKKVDVVPKKVVDNTQKINHTELISKIETVEDAKKSFNNLKKIGAQLTKYYREENFCDLRAIRITRFLSWVAIDELPMNQKGLTQINPPSEMTLYTIEETIKNKEYEKAFVLIENTLERSPYWLDGHLKSYEILKNLKKLKESNEIKNALISFVESNTGIRELEFKNSVPFVSEDTQVFLDSVIDKHEISHLSSNTTYEEKDISKIVKEMIQNHQKKEAIELLQEKYKTTLNYEDKFKLRLGLVKLKILNKDLKMISALIIGLEKDVQRYHLDEWCPDLALEVYKLLVKYFDAKYMKDEKLNHAYEQICRLDVSQAFNLK